MAKNQNNIVQWKYSCLQPATWNCHCTRTTGQGRTRALSTIVQLTGETQVCPQEDLICQKTQLNIHMILFCFHQNCINVAFQKHISTWFETRASYTLHDVASCSWWTHPKRRDGSPSCCFQNSSTSQLHLVMQQVLGNDGTFEFHSTNIARIGKFPYANSNPHEPLSICTCGARLAHVTHEGALVMLLHRDHSPGGSLSPMRWCSTRYVYKCSSM